MAEARDAAMHQAADLSLKGIGAGLGVIVAGIAIAVCVPWAVIALTGTPSSAPNDAAMPAIRRVVAPDGTVVVGFFEGPVREAFDHKVISAYRWPVDEIASRLAAAGFVEVERLQRGHEGERRPHAVLVARAV